MEDIVSVGIDQYDKWIKERFDRIDDLEKQRANIEGKTDDERVAFEASIDAQIRTAHQELDEFQRVRAAYVSRK